MKSNERRYALTIKIRVVKGLRAVLSGGRYLAVKKFPKSIFGMILVFTAHEHCIRCCNINLLRLVFVYANKCKDKIITNSK